MKSNIINIVLAILLLAGASCTGSGDICLSGQMSVTTNFYSYHTSTETTDKDTSINMRYAGLYPRYDTTEAEAFTNNIFLPLSMETDSTKFALLSNGLAEEITFYHQKELAYISEECGFIFHFTIDSVDCSTSRYISDIEVIDNEISYNKGTGNVKIYID